MPEYRYQSQDENGKPVSGKMDAYDEADLQKKLHNKGLMLTSAKQISKKVTLKPLKKSELANFCNELGTMTHAGVPLVKCLEILAGSEAITPYEKSLYIELRDRVVQGVALSNTMEKLYPAFPPLLIYMFRASDSLMLKESSCLHTTEKFTETGIL